MLDERLVGCWSDEAIYQGNMEASDVAFRPDGAGWLLWMVVHAFSVHRFRWETLDDQQIVLRWQGYLSGSWDGTYGAIRYHVDDRRQDRGKVALGYTVQAGQDVLRRPATLLEFSDRLKLGIAGPRYGFKRALDGDEHDPVWD